jgi:hypothetical protein
MKDKSIANVAGPAPRLARFLPNSINLFDDGMPVPRLVPHLHSAATVDFHLSK